MKPQYLPTNDKELLEALLYLSVKFEKEAEDNEVDWEDCDEDNRMCQGIIDEAINRIVELRHGMQSLLGETK